ncbi:hypothetical protein [Burkholderia cepacia]|uniref:hypothetical protein n=1 Tax=Burkholderia cepacia TaxID=292 RepID=UPI0011BE696F|nr:hypothetical protein [Burkholderia cepacia]MCE4129854.1 hypothetical protein [Burkholderia cepacia]MDN7856286.1 hypothetical protein [Burkholderia cepacia]
MTTTIDRPRPTAHSLRLGALYFPILVDCAREKQLIEYGELIDLAKKRYPDDSGIQNSIPVSLGKKLDVVRMFCLQRGLPDLAGIVIGKGSGQPGRGYAGFHSADDIQQQVFAFDWQREMPSFNAHVVDEIERVTSLVKRKKDAAGELLYAYYRDNKAELPADIIRYKERILTLLLEGHEVADAFEMAVND